MVVSYPLRMAYSIYVHTQYTLYQISVRDND